MDNHSVTLHSLRSKDQLRFFVKDQIEAVGSGKRIVPVFEENQQSIFAFLEKENSAHLLLDSQYEPAASEFHCADSIEELIAQHNAAMSSACREVCLWVESPTWGLEESLLRYYMQFILARSW